MSKPDSFADGVRLFCQFCLLLILAPTGAAGEVSFFGIAKTAAYSQTGVTEVVQAAVAPFSFRAFVGLSPGGKLLLAILTPPDGNAAPLILPVGGTIFSQENRYDTERDLNAAYPPGVYRILTHTLRHAARLVSMSLPANAFPNPPRLQNYEPAQQIESNADFTLVWEPFSGGTRDDLVQLQVTDDRGRQMLATPGLGQANAFSGGITSIVIPSGTLQADQTYRGKLLFGKFTSLDKMSYPDAIGMVGFFSETSFPLRTLAPASEPVIETADLPIAFVNQPYAAQLRAQPGTPPYHWTLLEGGLPAGLRLGANDGTITGKPELVGTNTVSVLLTDAAGRTDRRTFQMQVQADPAVIALVRIDLAPLAHGFFRLQFSSFPGTAYQIESSSDFTDWHPVLTTNATSSSVFFSDPDTPTQPLRFYRVRTSPTAPVADKPRVPGRK